jgi:hypothetical protein
MKMKSKHYNLLCIDPGGTTGVSIINYSEDSEPQLWEWLEVEGGLEGFIDFYQKTEPYYNWQEIVCESFTLRTGVKFPDLSPVYIIGALEVLGRGKTITYQPPTSKPICSDDVLKRIDMHKRGMGHVNDSTRHGIIYLRNKKHMPTIKMAWPKED